MRHVVQQVPEEEACADRRAERHAEDADEGREEKQAERHGDDRRITRRIGSLGVSVMDAGIIQCSRAPTALRGSRWKTAR